MKTPLSCVCIIAVSALAVVVPATLCAQEADRALGPAAQDSVLLQQERAQWVAFKAHDTTTFARLMGGGLVDIDLSGIRRTAPASVAQYVLGCQVASYGLNDLHVIHFAVTAVVTYKVTIDASCWGQKAPSPLNVMTVYEQRGNEWRPIAHSETAAAYR